MADRRRVVRLGSPPTTVDEMGTGGTYMPRITNCQRSLTCKSKLLRYLIGLEFDRFLASWNNPNLLQGEGLRLSIETYCFDTFMYQG